VKLFGVQIILLIESFYFRYYYSYLKYVKIMHISDIDRKNELLWVWLHNSIFFLS